MRIKLRPIPLAASLAVASFVTAILWYVKQSGMGPFHPVFFYLLPVALLTMVYGRLPALLCASLAMLGSAYFLYDPVYSFRVTNRLEVGDLICFAVLAVIAVQCTCELLRPPTNISPARTPYGRL
jgi:K+-sensing histidine kinase KdpD